jgi:heptosyltransferase-1
VALRKWRRRVFSLATWRECRALRQRLREDHYDLILDAQGLIKSAWIPFFAKGKRVGLNYQSAREPLASLAYQQKVAVNFYQHAVIRMRSLFALALGYPLPDTHPDFGLQLECASHVASDEPHLVFLIGTSWVSKQWPVSYWRELAKLANQAGYRVKVSAYHEAELECAAQIAAGYPMVDILPGLGIKETAMLLQRAKAVVAVDTGLGHLASALNVPTVSLYGPTNAEYTGAIGERSSHLSVDFPCSPCLRRECHYQGSIHRPAACFATLPPERVWAHLCRYDDNGII